MKKICIILGTRPEIVKMSPIIRECQKRSINFFILHTNQHYSESMDAVFFENLNLPKPKYNLGTGSGLHGEMTGKMLAGIEKILIEEEPSIVLVEGDTNTVLAGALAAVKLRIKIGHVEAGLRSYFKRMPEETNRILADHCADYLFAPTIKAKNILLGEGILKKNIAVTGNTIVDAVYQSRELSRNNSKILGRLGIKKGKYFLLTIHREENVDDKPRLENFFRGLELAGEKWNMPILYPIHPRTKKMIVEFKMVLPPAIRAFEPVGFMDFLQLESNARMVLTDSGGIQEESCIMKVPCVTLRDNTERPETLDVGSNILAGADPDKILRCVSKMLNKKRNWKNPFGNGLAAKKIIDILAKDSLA